MKIFANKNIWKKLVIIFLIITIFSFVSPEPVGASIGGELMEPICDFLVTLCDGIMGVLHKTILGQDSSIINIKLKNSTWLIVLAVIAAVVLVTLVVLAVASTGVVSGIVAIVSLAIKMVAYTGGTLLVIGTVLTAADLSSRWILY